MEQLKQVLLGVDLGSKRTTEEILTGISNRKSSLLEAQGVRIREQYGRALKDREVLEILKAEADIEICAKCVGLPCPKIRDKKNRAVIRVVAGGVDIGYSKCRYERLRRERLQMEQMLKRAWVSAGYAGLSFEDYWVDEDNAAAVKAGSELLSDAGKTGLYLYGAYGSGKTMLAAILANEFIKAGWEVLFYKVPYLVKELTSAIHEKGVDKERDLIKRVSSVAVLILDDLGLGEKFTTYSTGRLSLIIDSRYEGSGLKTIITSNYTLKKLGSKLDKPADSVVETYDGSRIADRVRAMCDIVKLGGESRRRSGDD